MADSLFSKEVQNSPEHRSFGWQVDVSHQRLERTAVLFQDPSYRELSTEIKDRLPLSFDREMELAIKEGRIETIIPRSSRPITPETEAPRLVRERR